MILIDSNVLMYAAGADHPNKARAVTLLKRVAGGDAEAAIDAEVLQEILHRYTALGRRADAQRVYELARTLFPEVLAITGEVMDKARRIVGKYDGVSARDAVHAAVVVTYALDGIWTFDGDFDRILECRRVRV